LRSFDDADADADVTDADVGGRFVV